MREQLDKRVPHLAVTENTTLPKERSLVEVQDIGNLVFKLRRIKYPHMSRSKFAYEVDIAIASLWNLENGLSRKLDLTKADRIARKLGMKLSDLIKLVEDNRP